MTSRTVSFVALYQRRSRWSSQSIALVGTTCGHYLLQTLVEIPHHHIPTMMVFEKKLRLIGRSNIIVVHCNQNNAGHVLAEVGGLLESEY